jgi:hypothetical protein
VQGESRELESAASRVRADCVVGQSRVGDRSELIASGTVLARDPRASGKPERNQIACEPRSELSMSVERVSSRILRVTVINTPSSSTPTSIVFIDSSSSTLQASVRRRPAYFIEGSSAPRARIQCRLSKIVIARASCRVRLEHWTTTLQWCRHCPHRFASRPIPRLSRRWHRRLWSRATRLHLPTQPRLPFHLELPTF